eukprot:TRINITY_DN5194_c0_g1_i1.p1 TRINITY_DN5194_c0_g1~~TRINITY_DN5194_c0_g1_i1.p1  ORF type:complete len:265 (-),score=54.21 TRINITY_DN5194_c0_g1_i1:63-857(-)
METPKRCVAFQNIASAQLINSTSSENSAEALDLVDSIRLSERVDRARDRTHDNNEGRARLRAVNLQLSVDRDNEDRSWFMNDARIDEPPAEQQPLPTQPTQQLAATERAVRFLDEADTRLFNYVPTRPCDLSSTHELCLKAFLNRVTQALEFSDDINESEALDRGLQLRVEIELQLRQQRQQQQQHEEEEMNNCTLNPVHLEPWLVAEDALPHDEMQRQQRRCKRCFWLLDAGRMPEVKSRVAEGKRWQDNVRQSMRIFTNDDF